MIRYWPVQKWSAVTLKILSPTVLTMSSLGVSSDYSSYKRPIRQYCFQKKKKGGGMEKRGSSLHFLLEGELFCKKSQETSHLSHGQDWNTCPPSGYKKGCVTRVSYL